TKSSNKIHGELKIGQQQLGVRIENFERIKDFFLMGQNEIKELIKQSTAYMSGRLSGSERMMMEIDWFTDSERQELLNKINEKMFTRKGNRWSDNWEEHYDDY
ncbi:hypothetical protein V7111_27215, partial [Neobacillus niacini]|uniref:hypothetical protein n=1 Tax=Neobacillus niacini TaxID=86668 RepID=UPI00300397D8